MKCNPAKSTVFLGILHFSKSFVPLHFPLFCVIFLCLFQSPSSSVDLPVLVFFFSFIFHLSFPSCSMCFFLHFPLAFCPLPQRLKHRCEHHRGDSDPHDFIFQQERCIISLLLSMSSIGVKPHLVDFTVRQEIWLTTRVYATKFQTLPRWLATIEGVEKRQMGPCPPSPRIVENFTTRSFGLLFLKTDDTGNVPVSAVLKPDILGIHEWDLAGSIRKIAR